MRFLKNNYYITNILHKYKIDIDIEEVEKMYSENHRYYHTIDHVNFLNSKIFDLFIDNKINEYEKEILIISSIFHDIIYIIGDNYNELKSANFLLKCSNNKLNSDILKIYNIIIDTKEHKPKNYLSQIFCDIDMYTVSDVNFLNLLKIEKKIYKEYNIYGDKTYIENRILFLNKILETKYGLKNENNIRKLIILISNFNINDNYLDYINKNILKNI